MLLIMPGWGSLNLLPQSHLSYDHVDPGSVRAQSNSLSNMTSDRRKPEGTRCNS